MSEAKTKIVDGMKYRLVINDLDFELGYSSKTLAWKAGRPSLYSFAELSKVYNWSKKIFDEVKINKKGTFYICCGPVKKRTRKKDES